MAQAHLLLETGPLVDGVVELAESVAELVPVDEILKPFGQVGIVLLALGQGRDIHRIIGHERRLNKRGLHILVKQGGQAVAALGLLFHMHAHGVQAGARLLIRFPAVVIHPTGILYGLRHGHAPPRGLELDHLSLIGHTGGAAHRPGHVGVKFFDHFHHVVVVGVCLVGLHAGELRVVRSVHALVAEQPAHLVHAVETAHNQAFEIQFRFDAQEHVDIQRVVMGFEGTGRRANLQRVQDRRVHLQKAAGIEKIAHGVDHTAAFAEGLAHLGVDDHVHIALTVAKIRVLEAMELLRQHLEALAQQRHLTGVHADFALLGAKHRALHADHVADVHVLKSGICLLAQVVAAHVNLQITLRVQNVGKAGLAHHALGNHTARHADFLALQLVKAIEDIRAFMRAVVACDGVGVLPRLAQLAQLFAADALLLGQLLGNGGLCVHETLSFGMLMRHRLISSTLSFITPAGTSTSTVSPLRLPSRAAPMGLSELIFMFLGSVSFAPTMVMVCSIFMVRFCTFTVLPTPITSVLTSSSSTTTQLRRVFSISTILASMRLCSFLASSYSAFSLRSPKPRAMAICSEISLRLTLM